jgi:polyphenol oxidase
MQAAVHCWSCGGGNDQLSGPEIHFGWYFLPWHRAYLHFHERILGRLIGDPTFRLPYWDWDRFGMTPPRQTMPPVYSAPDAGSAYPANPLYDRYRAVSATDRLPSSVISPAINRHLLSQQAFESFGGVPNGWTGMNQGQLEAGPHDNVHNFVGLDMDDSGNGFEPGCGGVDMGDLATAARDPIFFAHHGNVDRYWEMWRRYQQNAPDLLPDDSDWLNQTFTFYDERSRWVSISVAQVLDTTGLSYTYEDLTTTVAPPAPPSGPFLTDFGTTAVAGPGPLALNPNGSTWKASLTGVPVTAPRRYLVHLRGIEVPGDAPARAFVFLNAADLFNWLDPAKPVDPGMLDAAIASGAYLGSIGSIASRVRHHRPTFGATFEVPSAAAADLVKTGQAEVTILPTTVAGITLREIVLETRPA